MNACYQYTSYSHILTRARVVSMVTEEKSMVQEEQAIPENPEVMVFASYSGPPKYPMRVSILREMVGTSGYWCQVHVLEFRA